MGAAFKDISPRLIRVFYLVFIRNYFKNHPHYPYLPDKATTKIFVQDEYAEDVKYRNIDPVIIVESNGVQINNDSISNLRTMTMDKYRIKYGLTFTATGTLNIHVICQSSTESEELGHELALVLTSCRMHIARLLQLQFATTPSLSKPMKIERNGLPATYDSVITFRYDYVRAVETAEIDTGPILNEIDIILNPNDPSHKPGSSTDPSNPNDHGGGSGSGETGGTNTGGQTGNWGGTGDNTHSKEPGDLVDDGWIKIRATINPTTITEEQIIGEGPLLPSPPPGPPKPPAVK